MTIPKRKIVIDKITKKVKRWGYCDFGSDGQLDLNTEELIEIDNGVEMDTDEKDWYWNSISKTLQETQPE